MALTVEDGTGLSNADALVSLADFKAYHDAIGNDHSGSSDELIEQAIRRASRYLSDGFQWQGLPLNHRDQAMAWPRYDVIDEYGYAVPSNLVPKEIRDAVCELGWYELGAPGGLSPTFTANDKIKRERVDMVEVEYASTPATLASQMPALASVNRLVSGLLARGGSSALAGRSDRF